MTYATAQSGDILLHPRHVRPDGIQHVAATLGESMVAIRPDLSPGPLLAKSWDISEDGLTWTWQIRDDVWFRESCGPKQNESCGHMTVHDIFWSYREYHEGSHHPAARLIGQFWVGKDGGHQKIIDDYTVEIGTGKPVLQELAFNFMRHLGDYSTSIVSREQMQQLFEANGGNWDDRYQEDDPGTEADESLLITPEYQKAVNQASYIDAATGPWQLQELRRRETVKFKAVENHWRQTPHFAQFNMYFVPESSIRTAIFQAGQVDLMEISPDMIPGVQAAEGAEIIVWPNAVQVRLNFHDRDYYANVGNPAREPSCVYAWVSCNEDSTSREWQNAVKIRKALAIAIERQEIVEDVLSGHGEPMHMMDWLGHETAADPRWTHEYDPDLARKLLAEAGYGPDNPLRVSLRTTKSTHNEESCRAVAKYWKAVGVTVGGHPYGPISCHSANRRLTPALATTDYLNAPDPEHPAFTYYPSRHSWLIGNSIDLLTETDPARVREKELRTYGWLYDNVMSFGLLSMHALWAVGNRVDPDWRPIDYSELDRLSGFEYIKHRQ